MYADNEFDIKKVRDEIAPTTVHPCARGQHIHGIERQGRTVKEQSRCMCHGVPFKRLTILMTVSMMEEIYNCLNAFPSKGAKLSKTIGPATIIEGKRKPDFSYKRISFGSYAIVYRGTKNNMTGRGIPAIALKESNNAGGYYFMSLETGEKLHCHRWSEEPIDDYIINRVEELAEAEDQPVMPDGYPIFEWAPGIPMDGDDEVETEHELSDEENTIFDDQFEEDDSEEENSDEEHEHEDFNHNHDEERNIILEEIEYDTDEHETSEDDTEEIDNNAREQAITDENEIINENEEEEEEEEEERENVNEEEEIAEPVAARNDGRARRSKEATNVDRLQVKFGGKTYDTSDMDPKEKRSFLQKKMKHKMFMMKRQRTKPKQKKSFMQVAIDTCFTQMSAKKGFKLFGERAFAAMYKEFKQLDEGPMKGKSVVGTIDFDSITADEKRNALEAVSLMKEKRTGGIKGRVASNGSKQKKYLKEGESISSPTVSLEALLMTLIIDVFEGQKVTTFDVPGAYLHAKFPEDKHISMVLRGEFVDIMCDVNPEHKPNVRIINGKKYYI